VATKFDEVFSGYQPRQVFDDDDGRDGPETSVSYRHL